MGAIILASNEASSIYGADLKLLTTLALQSSSAIESALLYEKNMREAKEREEAMRHVYEATGKFVPYEFIGSLGHNVITDVKLGRPGRKNCDRSFFRYQGLYIFIRANDARREFSDLFVHSMKGWDRSYAGIMDLSINISAMPLWLFFP